MDISSLGLVEELQLPKLNVNKDSSDAFSQLLAALFMNLPQNTQLTPSIIQGGFMEESLETQSCKDDTSISMIRALNPEVSKILENSKENNTDIEGILKELGITEGQDLDNALNKLLKPMDIAISEVENDEDAANNLVAQVNKQIKNIKAEAVKEGINKESIAEEQNNLKISRYFKKDVDNSLNLEAKPLEVKAELDNTKIEVKSEVDVNTSQNSNQENVTLLSTKQQIPTNTKVKVFEVTTNENKENPLPFITKPQDLVDVTVNRFKALRLPDFTEMRVKLRPEELGEVTVKVVLEKGQINGSIVAERKDVVSMLQNQIDYLKQELKSNNINFNNITINHDLSGDFNGHNPSREFKHQGKNNGRRFFMDLEENPQDSISNDGFTIIA